MLAAAPARRGAESASKVELRAVAVAPVGNEGDATGEEPESEVLQKARRGAAAGCPGDDLSSTAAPACEKVDDIRPKRARAVV